MEDSSFFPILGVRLNVFSRFIDESGGRDAFYSNWSRLCNFWSCLNESKSLTTTEVCTMFLKPITGRKRQSYCEYLQEQNSPDVGEANVFISHAWKCGFLDVVDALQHHFSNEPDVFIWFDLFSINQYEVPNVPLERWGDTFSNMIGKMGRVVAVLSPWDKPLLYTRTWCMWEIYCAIKTGSKFEVAMTPDNYRAFLRGITKRPEKFCRLLGNISIERSKARNYADKERIFDVVKFLVGFAELNIMIIEKMREWLIIALNG